MKEHKSWEIGGVIHCFSYGLELAKEYPTVIFGGRLGEYRYYDMGFYLGIGGVVTFANAKKLKEVVSYMPLDRIVLETDCPYLSPVPFRGKRNSSLNLPYVAEAISQLKGITKEKVIEITNENARKLYRLGQ